jgi:hypothetical protein
LTPKHEVSAYLYKPRLDRCDIKKMLHVIASDDRRRHETRRNRCLPDGGAKNKRPSDKEETLLGFHALQAAGMEL